MAGKAKRKKNSQFKEIMHRLAKNKLAMAGLVIVIIEIFLAIIAPLIIPYDCNAIDVLNAKSGPSMQHLFGTDELGRDIFSRVLGGAGTSFLVALAVVAIGCVFGLLIGGLCGYYGGVADAILTRL